MLKSICTRPSKTGFFSYDIRRAGMVKGIGKVCDVHQHPCVVVPAYLPTVDVLDNDDVWSPHNLIYFSRVRKTCFTSNKFRSFENKQKKNYFFISLRVLCFSRVCTEDMGREQLYWVLYLRVAILPYFFSFKLFIYFSLFSYIFLRIFYTLHFLHPAFSTLRIFYTPHFPHSAFSTLRIFYTPHFLHSSFSTLRIFYTLHSALRTPRFPLNLTVTLVFSQV